ncbi:DUF3558 domain-containing protein [Amycolatopsis sp. NPDC059027]|uniref:DUF3558 domain-containing protein n=1 Tax=unclassified Amycolatopsis TaxID=2618356 RepID=UPI00366C547C
MTVKLLRIMAASSAVLCLAACSSTTGGTAQPSPTAAGTASSAADPNVPKVSRPLDASAYVADPCKLVPQSVLTPLRYTEPGTAHTDPHQADTQAGPYCGWMIGAEGLSLQVFVETGNRDRGLGGLAGLYTGKRSGQLGFLEPAPSVEGYPAVYADKRDRRAGGNCNLDVGIADDLVFSVAPQGYKGQQDSCQVAQTVAAAVIKTLKGA